ncbi:hypothetical protein BXY41_11860 [Lacrimispora xylanisolvens]|jgi:hypothetical protein|uniref:DUF3006 family protein n=1 Tax=Lacrimispora xylanisolvens TaxID=384636 RepID=A0A2S6HFZ4_9FIRM|nr:DUF3006 domain-containing protein [Hungatella xylanolytica]MBE5987890.1 DUF3006 domain-containing protein [Paenibacillaceae bacterium]PPK76370.1 hypothetical protein BXY41_11860 [Hungatella xylanolytica]
MQYIIDRIEQEIAICEEESGAMVKLPLKELPKGSREGDVLFQINGAFQFDGEETNRRRQKMREKLNRLIK